MNDNDIVMTKFLAILFAICSGLAIGNLYWAQPLLVQIMDGFGLPAANGGLLVTATQIGYAMGILFILPLGDFVRRKRMIALVMVLSVLALVSCAISPSFIILSLSLFSMGIVTISGQIILPLAGDLSREDERGHIVGIVSSGITTGILFSRFASGIIAGFWGWRSVYVIAAALNLVMVLVMIYVLPEIPAKNKFKSYGKLLASVFTTFKNHSSLPNILLHSGLIFGLIFNIFWTSLTFLLSAEPFNYCLVSMVCGFAFSDSIVAIVIVAAVLSVAVQGVSVLTQTRLFNLSQGERSRLNTVFVVNNFIFGAVGSALASLLWSLGGWSYVMIAASAVSVAALIVWLFSRSKFKYADESLDN
ncbi:MFS transporter [uncultured Methanobrevibacter sp.]|uniref:MFS transporter n=1 Tax=uncultured Methanobrevibacter sp. TaxID=253161 RepID=UPI0025F567DB|nr:MFS transporter [uncultured Methanobrevibacter sp.]